jgi:hypothetical protein
LFPLIISNEACCFKSRSVAKRQIQNIYEFFISEPVSLSRNPMGDGSIMDFVKTGRPRAIRPGHRPRILEMTMDIAVLGVGIAFFAMLFGYLRLCERL